MALPEGVLQPPSLPTAVSLPATTAGSEHTASTRQVYSGKDASVSDVGGGFNFIFENTTDYDIYIKAYVDVDKKQTIDKQGVLTVEFYKIIY